MVGSEYAEATRVDIGSAPLSPEGAQPFVEIQGIIERSLPPTFSSWWSGEDYDARRQPTDWTAAGTLDGPGWRDAGLVTLTANTTPTETTPLIADQRPPVTVAREAHPVAIQPITPPAAR